MKHIYWAYGKIRKKKKREKETYHTIKQEVERMSHVFIWQYFSVKLEVKYFHVMRRTGKNMVDFRRLGKVWESNMCGLEHASLTKQPWQPCWCESHELAIHLGTSLYHIWKFIYKSDLVDSQLILKQCITMRKEWRRRELAILIRY